MPSVADCERACFCGISALVFSPLVDIRFIEAILFQMASPNFSLQKRIPLVVFMEPMRRKNGTQTAARTTPKRQKLALGSMLVMPKTEVTNVKGRKNMLTSVSSLML